MFRFETSLNSKHHGWPGFNQSFDIFLLIVYCFPPKKKKKKKKIPSVPCCTLR
jgi:hypothetical protein